MNIEQKRAYQRTEQYKIKKRIRDIKYRMKKNPNLKTREYLSPEEAERRRKERKKKEKARKREKNDEWIENYKKDKKCSMCGFNKHTEILQFHHIKKDKLFSISQNKDKSLDTIKTEIEKCILLCPNCHLWLHHVLRKQKIKI